MTVHVTMYRGESEILRFESGVVPSIGERISVMKREKTTHWKVVDVRYGVYTSDVQSVMSTVELWVEQVHSDGSALLSEEVHIR